LIYLSCKCPGCGLLGCDTMWPCRRIRTGLLTVSFTLFM